VRTNEEVPAVANVSKEVLAEVKAAIEKIRQRCTEGAPGHLRAAIVETMDRLAVHLEGVEVTFGELQRLLQSDEKSPDESRVEALMASAAVEVESTTMAIQQMEEAVAGLRETIAEYEDTEIARLHDVVMKRIDASRKTITSVEKALVALQNRLVAYGLAHRGQGEA